MSKPLFRIMAPIAALRPGEQIHADDYRLEIIGDPDQMLILEDYITSESRKALWMVIREGRVYEGANGVRSIYVTRWGREWLIRRGMSQYRARAAVKQLEELGLIIPVALPPNPESPNLIGAKMGVLGGGIEGLNVTVPLEQVWKAGGQRPPQAEPVSCGGESTTRPDPRVVVDLPHEEPPRPVESQPHGEIPRVVGRPTARPQTLPRGATLSADSSPAHEEAPSGRLADHTNQRPTSRTKNQIESQSGLSSTPQKPTNLEFGSMLGTAMLSERLDLHRGVIEGIIARFDEDRVAQVLRQPVNDLPKGWLTGLMTGLLVEPEEWSGDVNRMLADADVSVPITGRELWGGFWLMCGITACYGGVINKPNGWVARLLRGSDPTLPAPVERLLRLLTADPETATSGGKSIFDLKARERRDSDSAEELPTFSPEEEAAIAWDGRWPDDKNSRWTLHNNPNLRRVMVERHRLHLQEEAAASS